MIMKNKITKRTQLVMKYQPEFTCIERLPIADRGYLSNLSHQKTRTWYIETDHIFETSGKKTSTYTPKKVTDET